MHVRENTFAEADAKLRRIIFQSLSGVSASTPAKA